jgi:ATP phosphoribosyltransferase
MTTNASAPVRIAIPSKGRLRDSCLDLLTHAGYSVGNFAGDGVASANASGIEFIEMRPRDAAQWLATGQLAGAFISTDTALESQVDDLPSIELGFSRSELMIAVREDDPRQTSADLAGGVVATHLPGWTRRHFEAIGVDVTVVPMGGALEGPVAVGIADAIVDLRETGGSLARNRLRVLESIVDCQAVFSTVVDPPSEVVDLCLRLEAALAARRTQYVMLHIDRDKIDALCDLFPGLAAPTILPLAGRTDLVAAHIVVKRRELWAKLADLRALGATGIVALPTDAIVE